MAANNQFTKITEMRAKAFYGKTYFYTTANDGHKQIGVMQGLGGDIWIVGYFRDNGARRALKVKSLWATSHKDNLQERLDAWAKSKGLPEVPS